MKQRRAGAVASPEVGRGKRRKGAVVLERSNQSIPGNDAQGSLQHEGSGEVIARRTVGMQLDPSLLVVQAEHADAAIRPPDRQDASGATVDEAEASGVADGPAEPDLPDIEVATAQLAKLTGISSETALNALKETQESVFRAGSEGSSGSAMLDVWVEEAQIWLACNMEVQGEIDEVRVAMQESLQEYEAAKAADDMPLTERPPDYLRDRFQPASNASSSRMVGAPGSVVVRRITAFTCYRALFAAGSHKAPLVKLAELECKCHRWYPNKGTVRFWEGLAEECTAAAVEAAGATAALKVEGWVGCDQGSDGCITCAAALGKDDAGPSTSTQALAPALSPRSVTSAAIGSAMLAAMGAFAACMAPKVEEDICKMPTVSGQIPDVFAVRDDPPCDSGGSDADYVEIIDSDSENGHDQADEL